MKPLMACRPVDLDLTDPIEAMIEAKTFVYEGSVQGTCDDCGRAIWIGPRQQTVMNAVGTKLCFPCTIKDDIGPIVSLDNPEKPHA